MPALDNTPAELATTPMALGRKNRLCAGSEGGGSAAIAAALLETARMNDFDPQAWLMDDLSRIADHKMTRRDGLFRRTHSVERLLAAASRLTALVHEQNEGGVSPALRISAREALTTALSSLTSSGWKTQLLVMAANFPDQMIPSDRDRL